MSPSAPDVAALVAAALAEDLGERGDITSQVIIPASLHTTAQVVSRSEGILAGVDAANEVVRQTGLTATWHRRDGHAVSPGTVVGAISGPAQAVLIAERTLLNLLCHLSGIATLTAAYVDAAMPAAVLDTRKTTPGLRALEKAAVVAGGGTNHRMGLYDRVLVKDNHLALAGAGLGDAVRRAREHFPEVLVEVEADDLDGVRNALEAGADWILLDNMTADAMRQAVQLVAGRARLEASGGMTLDGARAAADCGVDAISVGALTHSAAVLDLGLDIAIPDRP